MLMSHTSESVPPSLGAMFLYCFVFESKTARFETLATTVPLRCLTWVNLPPSQMLVPTCSIVRTVPLTIGVLSGFSEGNASTVPLAKTRATAVENNNKRVLLKPISFFSRVEEDRMKTPTPLTQLAGNNRLSQRIDTSARHPNFLELRHGEVRSISLPGRSFQDVPSGTSDEWSRMI